MVTIVIVAIAVALAVPTWEFTREKRRLTAAVEEVASLMNFAQSEAIKRNDKVWVSWYSAGSHSTDWCIGASLAAIPCNCRQDDSTQANFCAVDGVEHRLQQADFTDVSAEFMHMNPTASYFAYDPIRGWLVDMPNLHQAEILDDDYLFYVHSAAGSGSTRLFELQLKVNITGRISICADTDRVSLIGGYPEC
jgi:type II secretory pathway pseudopilin PulG